VDDGAIELYERMDERADEEGTPNAATRPSPRDFRPQRAQAYEPGGDCRPAHPLVDPRCKKADPAGLNHHPQPKGFTGVGMDRALDRSGDFDPRECLWIGQPVASPGAQPQRLSKR
jgi:hypothetical protein